MIFLAIIELDPDHVARMVAEYTDHCRNIGKLTYNIEPMLENYWVITTLESYGIRYDADAIMIKANGVTDNCAIYTNHTVHTQCGIKPAMRLNRMLNRCAKE